MKTRSDVILGVAFVLIGLSWLLHWQNDRKQESRIIALEQKAVVAQTEPVKEPRLESIRISERKLVKVGDRVRLNPESFGVNDRLLDSIAVITKIDTCKTFPVWVRFEDTNEIGLYDPDSLTKVETIRAKDLPDIEGFTKEFLPVVLKNIVWSKTEGEYSDRSYEKYEIDSITVYVPAEDFNRAEDCYGIKTLDAPEVKNVSKK